METRYKEPSLEQIKRAIAELAIHSHSNRRDTIKELERFAKRASDPKILLGAVIYFREQISLEYLLRSPSNSHLYNELTENVLVISPENFLSEKEKLIYLKFYFDFQRLQLREDATKVRALSEKIQPIADHILKNTGDLKTSLTKKPARESLHTEIKRIPKLYQDVCKLRYWNNNLNHQKIMLLIKFLSTSEADRILLKLSRCRHITDDAFQQYKYTVYFGTLLYTLLFIEKEYEGSLLKANNSDLYKYCRTALNIDSVSDVPAIIQINLFADFRRFLREVTSDPAALDMLTHYAIKEASLFSKVTHFDRNKMEYFSDAKSFLETHAESIESLMESKSFLSTCASSAVNYIILTSVGLGCFELSSFGYDLGIGKGLIVDLGSKLGAFLIKGPWGAYIGEVVATKYEKDTIVSILTSALVFSFKYIREWIGSEKISALDDMESADKFRAELKDELDSKKHSEEEASRLLAWYSAVTTLPSTKISPEIKERVKRAVFGPPEEVKHETTLRLRV